VPGPSDTGVGIVDVVLTIFLAGSVVLLAVDSSRRTQVGAYLSLGAVLSIVWLRLGVVDVALAEAALGGGVLSAVLVWLAVAHPRGTAYPVEEEAPVVPRRIRVFTGLIGGVVLAVVLGSVILRARHATPAWSESLAEGMAATGVDHEITAVLLSFRAYDTLLESAVLLLAGIVVEARTRLWTPTGMAVLLLLAVLLLVLFLNGGWAG
jgi:multisubunit Na+/H+ antiporter MnhB subunit